MDTAKNRPKKTPTLYWAPWERRFSKTDKDGKQKVVRVVRRAPKKPILGFEKLPNEIVYRIAELCLVQKTPIEMCPEPFEYELGHCLGHSREERVAFAKRRHAHLINTELKPYLGLLLTCKGVSEQAIMALYSQEFRFTNAAGWTALDFFLFQIGEKNVSYLKTITVVHPYYGGRPTSSNNSSAYAEGITRVKWISCCEGDVRQRRFGYRDRWFENPVRTSPAKVLESVGKLQQLNVIVGQIDYNDSLSWLSSPVDVTKFLNLKITLVQKSIRGMPCPSQNFDIFGFKREWRAAPFGHDWLAEQLAAVVYQRTGERWQVAEANINKCGEYSFQSKAVDFDRVIGEMEAEEDGEIKEDA